jgi:Trypsin-like peptidase domain
MLNSHCRQVTLAFVVALSASHVAANDPPSRLDLSKVGKAATALLATKGHRTLGAAFCVDPSGLFVTNEHVVAASGGSSDITLVLHPGEKGEKVFKARAVRRSTELDLALLRAEGAKGLPALPLGSDTDLTELMELIAFGFPFGNALAGSSNEYPAISVTVGSVNSLRRKAGELDRIQLDAVLNPGNSGGPVLDRNGKVIGVVVAGIRGSGVNFAIPVSHVLKFLATPDLRLTSPTVDRTMIHKPAVFRAAADSALPSDKPLELELILPGGDGKQRTLKMEQNAEGYHLATAPVPELEGPVRLRLTVRYADSTLTATTEDREFTAGSKPLRLSDICGLTGGPQPSATLTGGKPISGPLVGLDKVPVTLGGVPVAIDLQRATEVSVERPDVPASVTYTVVAKRDGREVGRATATILVSDKTAAGGLAGRALRPPLEKDKTVRPLPASVTDVAVGGDGRYLILHLARLNKLAVFDVNAAKVLHWIPVTEEGVLFTAGLEKLLVALPKAAIVQRWDLASGEREATAPFPDKLEVRALALGRASNGPALFYAKDEKDTWPNVKAENFGLLDVGRLKRAELNWSRPAPNEFVHLGQNVHLCASADGKVFGVWGRSGGHGLAALTVDGNSVRPTFQFVPGTYLAPSDDGKVFASGRGLLKDDLKQYSFSKAEDGRCVPADRGSYYLCFGPAPGIRPFPVQNQGSAAPDHAVEVRVLGDERPLTRLTDLDLPGDAVVSNGLLTFNKRVHFVPRAKLIVTLPAGEDRLVLHRFDPDQAIEQSDLDYLFVTSQAPPSVKRGEAFRYQLVVKSRRKDVRYKLEDGPKGMSVSDDGLVRWDVPQLYREAEAAVILSVRNGGNQECFHSFSLTILDTDR